MEGRTAEEKQGITLLGNQKTKYPDDYAPQLLETFINKHQDNDYLVHWRKKQDSAFVIWELPLIILK